ncbi:hypothetical protein KY284_012857 [Solanum tuberosum]|nr:hypothetical protein KY284_012857 [Solanum tuberosum]
MTAVLMTVPLTTIFVSPKTRLLHNPDHMTHNLEEVDPVNVRCSDANRSGKANPDLTLDLKETMWAKPRPLKKSQHIVRNKQRTLLGTTQSNSALRSIRCIKNCTRLW